MNVVIYQSNDGLVKSQWKMSAKEYLTATDMPVKMISIDMHYDDSFYM